MNKHTISLIIVFSVLLILLGLALSVNSYENNNRKEPEPLNIRQSFENEGYKNQGKMGNFPCSAQEPACGYCSGIIIDGFCYIKQ